MKLLKSMLAISSLTVPLLSQAAIPYQNEEYTFTQPNGEVLSVFLNGNTYYAEQRTQSGALVVFDKNLKGMAYATVSDDGTQLVSTGVLASERNMGQGSMLTARAVKQPGLSSSAIQSLVEQKQQELMPAIESPLMTRMQTSSVNTQISGQVKGLTIIIDFPDERGTITQSQVERFLNDRNYTEFGNAQSVRGYFWRSLAKNWITPIRSPRTTPPRKIKPIMLTLASVQRCDLKNS